ncbi:hypothetical protein [Flavobacterium frigoris]|uniref:RES domain-containing protein n=1 Tax=Flavobacterium frigoris (strain PS1) TaxID=1086011 RepID=H7FQD4_FLAFP|nr:hypothetical protein [Flavobacterium frigoris]EIA09487.1 hypothetical protein HJ01_01393 [Flavobacterium frigoris PS1]
MDAKSFFSSQQLSELIDIFKSKDTKSSSIQEYLNDFGILTTFFGFVCFDMPATIKMHRVRINEKGKDFTCLNELWCPPIDKIERIGRCNDKGEQILYMSGGGDTALREINPPIGSVVTCLECELVEDIKVFEIGVLKNNQGEVFLQQLADFHKISINQFYKGDQDLIDLDTKLKDYIVEEFTKQIVIGDEHLYKKTISIAKYFLSNPTIEGLMFPSIKSNLLSINYAIPKQFADKKLKPTRIDVLKIVGNIDGRLRFEFLKGCYENINFSKPINYTNSRPIEGWAFQEKNP